MKICLECAEGGHLDEMLSIVDAFEGHDIFFVTTRAETTEDLWEVAKVYYVREQYNIKHRVFIIPIELFYMVKLLFSCSKILLKEKPQVIVSTSGGSTIPLSYLGKLLGVKIIYIESMARINQPSGTGKLMHPIADLFLVQWESMLKFYRKAKYWGRVI
jgi:UDP-N-acetylglucosamine:LPS N-acetylglucosamine transferase